MTSPDLSILAYLRFEMAFWEFLLQKEGDRSWLPLESSKVEVLEGRYRIVAHASQPHMPIEVRITHTATTEIPPIRRTQKRFSHTNKNGLVVIMPFTRLLPGVWDLRCTSDLMAEMLGEGWQYVVRLQVLPLEVEMSDDWEPDWPAGVTQAEITQAEMTHAEGTVTLPQPQSQHQSENIAIEDNPPVDRSDFTPAPTVPAPTVAEGDASDLLPLSAPSVASPAQPQSSTSDTPSVPAAHASDSFIRQPATFTPSVQLQLGQDAYVIQAGQPLTLMGQVETVDGAPSDRPYPLEALQVRLYDPRTSQILIEERQPLTTRTLPFPFTCRITLPDHFQTYLVLGEITLYGTMPDGTASALVTQPFSVTTDLHELLEAIANDFSEADLTLPASKASEPAALEPLHGLVAPIQFTPSPPQPLPPQLRPADPDKTWQSLDLPSFSESETAPVTESALEKVGLEEVELDAKASDLAAVQPDLVSDRPPNQAVNLTNSEDLGAETATAEVMTEATLPSPVLDSPASPPQAFDNDAPIPDWDRDQPRSHWQQPNQPPAKTPDSPDSDSPTSDSPEDVAFRSLNLQERFWTRLHALVADQELTEWLSTLDDGSWDGMSRSSRRSEERDAVLTAREVVADELTTPSAIEISSEFFNEKSGVPVVSIQQPIPVPQLEVVTGDLTAGQLLNVQVKLPDLSYPLYVKLWLVDRQNRSVLDGPYWLTDFVPSGFGDLVARYDLPVPQGCLELQLEAIAIEMTTQRESDKATVARHVIPPDLSNLALDELDV